MLGMTIHMNPDLIMQLQSFSLLLLLQYAGVIRSYGRSRTRRLTFSELKGDSCNSQVGGSLLGGVKMPLRLCVQIGIVQAFELLVHTYNGDYFCSSMF